MNKQRYSLPQLRGAYAAGKRDARSLAPAAAPAERREVDFAAAELVALADKHGLAFAFSLASDGHHWARGLIVNLAARYGVGAVHAAFEEAERRLLAAGHDEARVGYAMHCLECREQDVLADMAAIRAEFADEGVSP